jgi:hypothetical protein
MLDAERFRCQAVRLLDLATKAQEEGHPEYAGQLTAHAADYLDRAIALEEQQMPPITPSQHTLPSQA